MAHRSIVRRAGAALAAGWLAAAALSGCSKKLTAVDAGYVPEGTESAVSKLIAYPGLPSLVNATVRNEGRIRVVPLTTQLTDGAPRAASLLLLDGSASSEFALYRADDASGAAEALPFTLRPFTRWLDLGWDAFRIQLDQADPSGRYRGLGLIDGVRTSRSPITNQSSADRTPTFFRMFIRHGSPNGEGSNFTDSLFTIAWEPVAGAAQYLLHVYQFRSDTRAPDVLRLCRPGPMALGKTRDIYLTMLPGTLSSHRVGDPDGIVLTRRTTFMAQAYFVRMSALDSDGRLLGVGVPAPSYPGEPIYALYNLSEGDVRSYIPSETAQRLLNEAFAVAPDAGVSVEMLALLVQTQRKLPPLEELVFVDRPPYDPGVWNSFLPDRETQDE